MNKVSRVAGWHRVLVCLLAAVVFPVVAYGSFGGTPCRDDFVCHFQIWGLLLGVVAGIPISIVVFMSLHLRFCHPKRSKDRQLFLGGVIGVVAYEIAAACAALMVMWEMNPWVGMALAYVALAVVSALYARSDPRPL